MLGVIMTGYLDREIATRVHEALRDMPVVVLTGLRQCGKSTFLGNDPALKKRRYFSLDRFGDLEAIRTNAEAILGEPGAVTIDEAQRMPGIMEIIKAQVDREGQIPGRFLLSGSANFALLKGVSESLAGRAIYIEMSPFSRREILRTTKREPFLLFCRTSWRHCPPAGRRLPFTIGTCRDATRWISSSPTGRSPSRSRSRRPPDGPIRTWPACGLFSPVRPAAAGGFLRMAAGNPLRSETASSHCLCRFSSDKPAPRGEDIPLFMIDDQAVPFLAQNGFIARQFELAGNA